MNTSDQPCGEPKSDGVDEPSDEHECLLVCKAAITRGAGQGGRGNGCLVRGKGDTPTRGDKG